MEFYPKIFHFFPLLLLALCMCYAIGHIFLSLFMQPKEQYYRIFLKLLIGQLLIITIYAIIKTKGNTTYLLVLLTSLILFVFFDIRKLYLPAINNVKERIKKLEIEPIIAIVISLVLFYLIQYSKFVNLDGDLKNLYTDRLFYVRVGNLLNATGIETTYNYLPKYAYLFKPTYGHYFEAWNSAFFSWIYSISGQYAMMLIYFPFTFSMVYVGAVVLAKRYTNLKNQYLIHFLSFGLIIIAPLTIRSIMMPLINQLGLDVTNKFNLVDDIVQKYSIIYIFFIWFFIELKSYNNLRFFIPLFFLGIIYPTTLPGIFGSIILGSIITYLRKEFSKEYLIAAVIAFILILCFALFYYFNKGEVEQNQQTLSLWSVAKSNFTKNDFWAYQFVNPLKKFIEYLIAFSPYLVLLLFLKKSLIRIFDNRFLIVLLLLIIPLFGSNLVYYVYDSFQFFGNIFTPLTNILLFIILLLAAQLNIKMILTYVLLLVVLNVAQTIRNKDYKSITYPIHEVEYADIIEDIKSKQTANFAIIRDSAFLFYQDPTYQLQRISNNIFTEDISWKREVRKANDKDEYTNDKYIRNTTFHKYVYENHLDYDISSAQLQFIKDAKINYLIANQNTKINDKILKYVDKKYLIPTQQVMVYRLKVY